MVAVHTSLGQSPFLYYILTSVSQYCVIVVNMSNQIRVRVQCPSMNQRNVQARKDKETEWDNWVKEKQQRVARLHKLQKKLNKSLKLDSLPQPHITPTNFEKNENMIVSVIEAQRDKNGYTRLEVIVSIEGVMTLMFIHLKGNPLNCWLC